MWCSLNKDGAERYFRYWARGNSEHCYEIKVSPDGTAIHIICIQYSGSYWKTWMTTARTADGVAVLIRRIGYANHHAMAYGLDNDEEGYLAFALRA